MEAPFFTFYFLIFTFFHITSFSNDREPIVHLQGHDVSSDQKPISIRDGEERPNVHQHKHICHLLVPIPRRSTHGPDWVRQALQ